MIAGRQQIGYSHRSHHVSGLAARGERSARWMIPGFVALGTSNLLMPTPDPSLTRLTRVAGATTIAAGLVQVSGPRCPQPGFDPDATASDLGHAVASVATFGVWTMLPLVARRVGGPRWYRFVCGVLAVAAVVGIGLAGATTRADSPDKGVIQRAFLGTVFAWHMTTTIASIGRHQSA